MTPKKAFMIMIGVLVSTIAIGGAGFYFGDGMLTERAQEISKAKAEQELISEKLATYQQSRNLVEKYAFVEDLAEKVLPQDKSQSIAIAEIKSFATDNGIDIQQITFGAGDGRVTDPTLSQTSTIKDLSGVRVLNTTVVFKPGFTFNQFLSFLKNIETNQRKMQITGITVTPDTQNRDQFSSASVQINIFLKGN